MNQKFVKSVRTMSLMMMMTLFVSNVVVAQDDEPVVYADPSTFELEVESYGYASLVGENCEITSIESAVSENTDIVEVTDWTTPSYSTYSLNLNFGIQFVARGPGYVRLGIRVWVRKRNGTVVSAEAMIEVNVEQPADTNVRQLPLLFDLPNGDAIKEEE